MTMMKFKPSPPPATAHERAPEYVRAIAPYVGGKPIEEVARELGLDASTIIKLASNENPRGPSESVLRAISVATRDLTRYPDGNGFALKAALSEALHVNADQIVLGNGSNDVLELASQAFLRQGDHAVYSQYAFIVYPLATQARGALGIQVPARDYGHDLDAMRAAITPRTRIVFVANPNNPTGTWLAGDVVESFVASVPKDVLVVLDEAYNEFLEPSDRVDTTSWLARYPNLVVSRTFSKAHGLAALRVGYGVMNAAVADLLNRVRQPFNVNSLAQAAAIAALADNDYVAESRRLNREGLQQLARGLGALSVRYLPSHGNFILIEVGDAARVNQSLLEQGVIVRPVANYDLPEWLRVTVGLPAENARFLAALETALGAEPASARARR
jgi:histidinol-phosphate aminotransferase